MWDRRMNTFEILGSVVAFPLGEFDVRLPTEERSCTSNQPDDCSILEILSSSGHIRVDAAEIVTRPLENVFYYFSRL
jgi:hypothetical protein